MMPASTISEPEKGRAVENAGEDELIFYVSNGAGSPPADDVGHDQIPHHQGEYPTVEAVLVSWKMQVLGAPAGPR